MGFVTIMVQHSWSLQPNSIRKHPSQPTNTEKEKKNTDVRLTDIRSVAKLIERFNQSVTQQSIEIEIRDVLDRLARLSLQSSIPDAGRIDPIRISLKATQKSIPADFTVQAKTRFYAAQARISLVAFASCKTQHLRDRAFDILLEALDTNLLSFDRSESNCLFQLIVQITKALQVAIDEARSKDLAQMRVAVDHHMERILKSLLLSAQRIEYFVDMESLVLTPENSDALHDICRELDMFRTDDPHIVFIIFTLHEMIKRIIFKASNEDSETEAATLRIALSFVSHVIRMAPPPNINQLQGGFEAILDDLHSKSKWFLGKKFINLLGAAAIYHIDACKLFLGIIKHLRSLHWQWMYQALLILGTIVLTAECSQIRKLALEDGILMYISFGQDSIPRSNFHRFTWTSRAACAIALHQISSQRRSSPLGLLSYSAINARKAQESHQVVLNLLKNGFSGLNRLSALFKYTGRALAEDYSESLDRLADLKHYLEKSKLSNTKVVVPKKKVTRRTDILNPYLKNLKLSVDAYHSNYKTHPTSLQEHKMIDNQQKITTKASSLAGSYSCNSSGAEKLKTQISIPTAGTANRRKLFNPKSNLEDNPIYKPPKIRYEGSEFGSESSNSNSLGRGIVVIPSVKLKS